MPVLVQGCVEKRQGRTYGPIGGRTMAIFVDDLSMPAVNEWGDQVETVLQVFNRGDWIVFKCCLQHRGIPLYLNYLLYP